MTHLLSEPDSKHTSSFSGAAAKGYRPAPSSMESASTTRVKHPNANTTRINGVDPMVEPQALYHNGEYPHPHMPSYEKPAHSTVAHPVEHAANYWQKIAESNSPPNSPSIEQATTKALHGAKPPKGI